MPYIVATIYLGFLMLSIQWGIVIPLIVISGIQIFALSILSAILLSGIEVSYLNEKSPKRAGFLMGLISMTSSYHFLQIDYSVYSGMLLLASIIVILISFFRFLNE